MAESVLSFLSSYFPDTEFKALWRKLTTRRIFFSEGFYGKVHVHSARTRSCRYDDAHTACISEGGESDLLIEITVLGVGMKQGPRGGFGKDEVVVSAKDEEILKIPSLHSSTVYINKSIQASLDVNLQHS